ncbi:MAG TPA: AAA family ATPase, partial [Terriglobia bacterium]|nr:AAA family ATPase [Terriglobia bacterium]
DNSEARVRVKLAEILVERLDDASTDVLKKLAVDAEGPVRAAAIKASSGRPECRGVQEEALALDVDWNVRFAAVAALDAQAGAEVVRALVASLQNDEDSDIRRRSAEYIERRLRTHPSQAQGELPGDISEVTKLKERLKEFGSKRFPKFTAWIESQTDAKVDPATIERFGTDLTPLAKNGTLTRGHSLEETCETVMKLLRQAPPRSIALLGPAGVGKSSLVHQLTYRLQQPEYGWHVLRVSPTDFMAGTKYLGEWETKLRELVEAIRKPRRVLLYIPNLSDLSAVGTWSKSDSSVATALGPYISDGSVIVLGEATPEEFERGLGKAPSLRRLFDVVLMREPDLDRTRSILSAIRDEEGSRIPDELLSRLLEVSSQFLSHISRPGNGVDLLRAAIKYEKNSGRVPSFREILDILSRSTGIPSDLLDESVPLSQDATKNFFNSKIIGQPGAVDAVVDLVTLIKAGVTDPNRPFGVFMFVGPTGVGKTELARALAEFIFGDSSRLKRFDMSEFANPEGFTRLIGNQFETGLLTDAVRQQPFSVILLDEIEKAHINIFDLCLQIFDAGRLTDGRGRTVDFRRTIIILTSNVGAKAGLLGFGSTDSERGRSGKERMPIELSRFFRPEFLNRLDRIIQFGPLSLEVADQIARKEIQAVLQRSGIRRRGLVVDVDAHVVSLIVKEGYSTQFGARPLKRTVERLLLLPLAKAISSGDLRKNSVLRLSLQSGRVKVTTTVPQVETAVRSTPAVTKAAARLTDLSAQFNKLAEYIEDIAARKSKLIEQTREPAFARNADLRSSVLNDIHNFEQFLSLYEEIGNALTSDGGRRDGISRLQQDLDHLTFVASCKEARALGDALIIVSLVNRSGHPQEAIQKITGMYEGLATRRRLTAEILGELYSADEDRAFILIGGLGAYGLLRREAGLHQVDRRYKLRSARSSREVLREDRELVRVDVAPALSEPSRQFHRTVKVKISPLKPVRKRLIAADFGLSMFHEPTLRRIELWMRGPKEDAVARGLSIMSACVDPSTELSVSEGIVRQYDLGLAPRIKDTRTGRVTTRVQQVLKGELDTLLDSD